LIHAVPTTAASTPAAEPPQAGAAWVIDPLGPTAGPAELMLAGITGGGLLVGQQTAGNDDFDLGALDRTGAALDRCRATVGLPTLVRAEGLGVSPATDLLLPVRDGTLPLHGLRLSQRSDGSTTWLGLQATMDLRDAAPLLAVWRGGRAETPESLCELALKQAGGCLPCPTDGQTWCLPLSVPLAPAERLLTPYQPVASDGCDPACDSRVDDPRCPGI
jgi:hypothetical protein